MRKFRIKCSTNHPHHQAAIVSHTFIWNELFKYFLNIYSINKLLYYLLGVLSFLFKRNHKIILNK